MSENATRKADGERIKIGTCESLYYLRFEQRGEVDYPWRPLTDSTEDLEPFLYRFPDPKEDGIAPGEYESAWGGVKLSMRGFWAELGDKVEHGAIQATSHDGYLFSLPCPEGSPEAYPGEYGKSPRVHRNGGTATVRIVAQRVYGGHLALVVECVGCRHTIRLPELSDAAPIVAELRAIAEGHRREAEFYRGYMDEPEAHEQIKANMRRDGDYWDEVARRVEAGYALDVAEVVAR